MSNKKYILLYGQFTDAFYRQLKKTNAGRGILVPEARPFLEGAKTVCRQLLKFGMKPTLISDNMAGFCFYQNMINEVHLAFQEINKARVVCKIGSLGFAVCAKYHRVPVYLHWSTVMIPPSCQPKDVFYFAGRKIAPAGIKAYTDLTETVPLKYIKKVVKDGK